MESKVIGNRIKALMQIKGIKRKELAMKLGISYNTLTKKLNGTREFTINEIFGIKEILNMNAKVCADVFFKPTFLIEEKEIN